MRAIKIDPTHFTISEINVKNLDEVKKIIGSDCLAGYQIDREIMVLSCKEKDSGKDAFGFAYDDETVRGLAVVIGCSGGKMKPLRESKASFDKIVEWR